MVFNIPGIRLGRDRGNAHAATGFDPGGHRAVRGLFGVAGLGVERLAGKLGRRADSHHRDRKRDAKGHHHAGQTQDVFMHLGH
jgi:hypothetical protein